MTNKIVCVVGTRPEAVKMAPIILRLRRDPALAVRVLTTGQHRQLLDQALGEFGIASDEDLDLMRPNQKLADLTARGLTALSDVFERDKPHLVLAQGDTTTVLCAALACYYQRIPFGHVEAGLRTGNPYFPFPEEKNRVLAGHLAELHFAPTETSRQNLLKEGIPDATIHRTGNTVIDALLLTARTETPLPVKPRTPRYFLVTAHRRENFGAPLEEICQALRTLADRHADISIVYPVHPNPNVRQVVDARLGRHERIHLIEPAGYREFVSLMKHAYLILTDSGGVQEEGPSLGKPVLVLRDETERPEAVAAGTVQLVGPHCRRIIAAVEELLADRAAYDRYARAVNPYGDGWAAERIARALTCWFGREPGPLPAGMNPHWPAQSER
jgi:UDP-N-acetylglucosamine 2-epimerase (non-hydrolysing)